MKNKKSVLIMVLLLLVAVTSAYVANTYAKYIGDVSGNGSAEVAAWTFETDNASSVSNISLSQTANATTLTSGKIAPGTSGSFDIALKNTNSDVGVDFTVALGAISGKPDNLHFYKDSGYTTEIIPGTDTITGQLKAKDATGVSLTIYWKWEYETGAVTNGVAAGDSKDTEAGEAAASLTIPVTITGVQVEPSNTTISSHIN